MPNDPLHEIRDICLFVRDLEKGIKKDHDKSVQHFKDLLRDKAGIDNITVISLRELKVEYKQFESKIALSNRFDRFLADDRIVRFLPKFLGKAFYKRKRLVLMFEIAFILLNQFVCPYSLAVPVNLKAVNLKAEIDKGVRTVTLPMLNSGTCAMVQVGNTQMKPEQLTQNIMTVAKVLPQKYPGGWKNIRSLNLKTEKSMAIPLHISTGNFLLLLTGSINAILLISFS